MQTIKVDPCPLCGKVHTYGPEIKRIAVMRRLVVTLPPDIDERTMRLFVCPEKQSMFQALVPTEEGEHEITEAFPASPQSTALFESAKQILSTSVEVGRTFSQFMITLNATLIPVYLGILKFIGIDKKLASSVLGIKLMYLISPLFLLISCALFILAYFPRYSQYSLEILDEISSAHEQIIKERKKWIFWASIMFLVGMLVAIIGVSIGLLVAPQEQ